MTTDWMANIVAHLDILLFLFFIPTLLGFSFYFC